MVRPTLSLCRGDALTDLSILHCFSLQNDLTTEATAAGSEQQYKRLRYISPKNLDGPSCGERWQGRTVERIVHGVYHRAFKEKHLKLAIKPSNGWVIIPPGNANERSKPADSYVIPCLSPAVQIMPLVVVGSLRRNVAPLVLSK